MLLLEDKKLTSEGERYLDKLSSFNCLFGNKVRELSCENHKTGVSSKGITIVNDNKGIIEFFNLVKLPKRAKMDMQLEAVIFDFGDTLVLTDKWDYDKCLKRLLASLQKYEVLVRINYEQFKHTYFEVRDQMYQQTEKNLEEVDFRIRISETVKKFNSHKRYQTEVIEYAAEAFIEAFLEDLRVEPFLSSLLTKLKSLYKLAIVSNFAYPPGLHRILQHFNLKQFFDTIVISGEFGFRKPHPKIFEEALRKLNVAAKKSVFVGDSLKADIYGAKRAGIKTILVQNLGLRKNPYAVAGELDPFPVKPEYQIPDLSVLPKTLTAL